MLQHSLPKSCRCDLCKLSMQLRDSPTCAKSPTPHPMQGGMNQNLYLAQAPLTGELHPLRRDTATPRAIAHIPLCSVNLWASSGATHSSSHYDPQPNLLCVACGFKQVTLWPPNCAALLSPHSLTTESPNHSALRVHDRAGFAAADTHAQQSSRLFRVRLRGGDALLIPQGWWHEVQSDARTIAVNFWMQPPTTPLAPHMAPFVLRESAHACMQAMRAHRLSAARKWSARVVAAHFPPATPVLAAAAELLQRALSERGLHASSGSGNACVACMSPDAWLGSAVAQTGHQPEVCFTERAAEARHRPGTPSAQLTQPQVGTESATP